jgi:hypothetical protein
MRDREMHSKSKLRIGLMALDLFMAIQGLGGGLGLLLGFIGAPQELLDGTPFASFVEPGVILLLAVGGGSLLAGVLPSRIATGVGRPPSSPAASCWAGSWASCIRCT